MVTEGIVRLAVGGVLKSTSRTKGSQRYSQTLATSLMPVSVVDRRPYMRLFSNYIESLDSAITNRDCTEFPP